MIINFVFVMWTFAMIVLKSVAEIMMMIIIIIIEIFVALEIVIVVVVKWLRSKGRRVSSLFITRIMVLFGFNFIFFSSLFHICAKHLRIISVNYY